MGDQLDNNNELPPLYHQFISRTESAYLSDAEVLKAFAPGGSALKVFEEMRSKNNNVVIVSVRDSHSVLRFIGNVGPSEKPISTEEAYHLACLISDFSRKIDAPSCAPGIDGAPVEFSIAMMKECELHIRLNVLPSYPNGFDLTVKSNPGY